MLRIFLVLSLAVALAGVAISFVLKDKVKGLTEERDLRKQERDKATAEAAQAKSAEKKAKEAEKLAKADLETANTELASTKSQLSDTTSKLAATANELEKTKVDRDTAQRELAQWKATGVRPEQILALKAEGQRLIAERDAFAEEKKVMGREIARLNAELDIYRGPNREVAMPDVRGRITSVDSNYQFVVLDVGADNGLLRNGKMIVSRDNKMVAKLQLVRVDPRSSVANLLPDWKKDDVKAGDLVMTSYEALKR